MESVTKQRARIRLAYGDCLERTRHTQRGFVNYLEQAFEAAQAGERQHRRGGGAWRMSVLDCARFFAVKWFLEIPKGPRSWEEACSIRDDARLAYGAADTCSAVDLASLRKAYADVLAYDYSEWVSR